LNKALKHWDWRSSTSHCLKCKECQWAAKAEWADLVAKAVLVEWVVLVDKVVPVEWVVLVDKVVPVDSNRISPQCPKVQANNKGCF
jgi:hypothetical protein